jgi:vacuolar-type H+-ATPase subunit H
MELTPDNEKRLRKLKEAEEEANRLLNKLQENKVQTEQELLHQKKYLIEEVLSEGETLSNETKSEVNVNYETPYYKMVEEFYELNGQPVTESNITKSPKKKSFWSRLMDAIFK